MLDTECSVRINCNREYHTRIGLNVTLTALLKLLKIDRLRPVCHGSIYAVRSDSGDMWNQKL